MKSFSLAVLLAVGQVTAAPAELQAINGVIPGGPPSNIKRQIGNQGNGNGFGSCNADPIFRALRQDNDVQGASSFCSSYIRPTATVSVTVSVPTTAIVTEFATTSTTTTTTAIVTGTSTVTCAAEPTAPTTCGVEAFGFGSFLISSEPNVDPIDCHEKCLADVNCKSFQVQSGGGFCNTFNAVTAGNVQPAPGSGFTFYDRDCSDLLPAPCTPIVHKKKRQVAPTPSYLATVAPSHISSVCRCFVTASLTTLTTTLTQQTTVPVTVTTRVTTTQVITEVVDMTTTEFAIITAPP